MMKDLMKSIGIGALVGATALGLGSTTVHAQDDEQRFVMITHGPDSDSWFNTVRNGLNAAAEAMGVSVEYRNPSQGDLANMARIVEQTVASRPDGIIVTIADYDVLEGPIRGAVDRGIPVVTVNSGTEEQSRDLGALMHIGQPEYYAGLKAGERAKAAGVTKFLCVNHYITNPASVERCNGYADGLGVELGSQMIDSGIDPTEVQNKVEAYLRQNPDTDGVVTLGPNSAHPTIRAIESMQLADAVNFGTFGISDQVIGALETGTVDFVSEQQPYMQGYMPVVVLSLYTKYGLLPANHIRTGPGFVTKDNLGKVKEFAGTVR